jgi:class 3 adenylate cyclase
VEPSAELTAVVRRVFGSMNARDLAALRNLHSDRDGVTFVGTDPDEWWTSFGEMVSVFEAQLGEFDAGGVTFALGGVEAYSEGTVGWAACRPNLVFPDGKSTELRWTGVLCLDGGIWRCVQWHLSVGVVNEDLLGFEMTTSIDSIAAAVQEERPDLTAAAASDGTLTIVFSDIERSTEVAVRLGDVKMLELLRWHDSVVDAAVAREGGRVVKSLGDGHMMVFPAASGALRAAIEIQRSLREPHHGQTLRLRVGLHTGEVLRRADDFFGRAVIMAARVAQAAEGGEILASALVVDLTESLGTFGFGEPRLAELKGIPGMHRLSPVDWEDGPSVPSGGRS